MSASGIRAGRAYVEVSLRDRLDAGVRTAQRKLKTFASKAASLGRAAFGVGAATATPFGVSLRIFSDFQDKMSAVRAVTGATGKDFQALQAKAEQLGAETSFSASQAAEGMKFLGMAGFDTAQILAAIPDVLNLAKAGAIELGVASDIASDIGSAFGLSADEIGRVADVIAKTATSTNTSVTGIGESMKHVAPLAKEMGQSIEEVGTAIGLLGDKGIKDSKAGTDLKNLITILAQNKEIKGVSTSDAEGNARSFLDVMREIGEATSSMSQTDRAAFMMEKFGKVAGASALILAGSGEAADKLRDKLNGSSGAAADLAKVMEDNIGGDFRSFGSVLSGIAIAVAKHIAPAARSFLKYVTGMGRSIKLFVDQNQGLVVSLAAGSAVLALAGVGLLGVATAANLAGFSIGGIAKVIKVAIAPARMLTSTLGALSKATLFLAKTSILGPFKMIRTILLSALAPTMLLKLGIAGIAIAVLKATGALDAIGNAIGSFFTSGKNAFGRLAGRASEAWSSISSTASTAFGSIVDRIKSGDIEGAFKVAKAGVVLIWKEAVNAIIEVWAPIKVAVTRVWAATTEVLKGYWKALVAIWSPIVDVLKSGWNSFAEFVGLNTGADGVFETWNDVVAAVSKVWVNLQYTAASVWESIKNTAIGAANAISGAFRESSGWIAKQMVSIPGYAKIVGSTKEELIANIDAANSFKSNQTSDESAKRAIAHDAKLLELAEKRLSVLAEIESMRKERNSADAKSVADEIAMAREERDAAKAAFDAAVMAGEKSGKSDKKTEELKSQISQLDELKQSVKQSFEAMMGGTNVELKSKLSGRQNAAFIAKQNQVASTAGTFSATAARQLGESSVMEKIANATERTADATEQIAADGGEVFA